MAVLLPNQRPLRRDSTMSEATVITARPGTCAIAWATKDGIFVEIPCIDGPPYICRYPRNAEGLAQALNVIIEKPARTDARTIGTQASVATPHPKVQKVGPKFTDEQRSKTQEILKRLKIT